MQNFLGLPEWILETTGQHRFDWMELEFERSSDAEICAGTAHRPEQIGMFARLNGQYFAIGSYDFEAHEAIAAIAEHGCERAFTTAE